METVPFDLPTLRHHYSYFHIHEKAIPILYRYKSDIYYPYVAWDLVINELISYSSTWTLSSKLPLLPMTVNERILYQSLCPDLKFTSSSQLISCSLIDQFLQLFDYLKETHLPANSTSKTTKFFGRFPMDVKCGTIEEIDFLNSAITTKYNDYRSIHGPSIQTAKRRLYFEEDDFQLSSIGGYLQLDRCIYPYVLSSSDILLNLNDLRKPFASTLDILMPYFHSQPNTIVDNYKNIVEYGTRYIKKYKYYYKNIDHQFISLEHLLLLHRSILFVQLFHSDRTSLLHLHEHYRSDFLNLLAKNLSQCGYVDDQPCVNGWSLYHSQLNHEQKSRLATDDETLLINWLLIYNHRETEVHHRRKELVLVKQSDSSYAEKMKSIQNNHLQKRAALKNATAR